MGSDNRHPLLADTSSLIAVGNTEYWDKLASTINLTTTNVCKNELKAHVESNRYAAEGSRDHYLKRGSQRILDILNDDSTSWTSVTVVPRPHGPNAGEDSLKQEIAEHPDAYLVVTLLDGAARRSIRRLVDDGGYDIDVVGPPYLLYLLLEADAISTSEFCEATGGMIRTEGWTGYEVVKSAWTSIPVDCSEHLDDDVLPG